MTMKFPYYLSLLCLKRNFMVFSFPFQQHNLLVISFISFICAAGKGKIRSQNACTGDRKENYYCILGSLAELDKRLREDEKNKGRKKGFFCLIFLIFLSHFRPVFFGLVFFVSNRLDEPWNLFLFCSRAQISFLFF